MEREKLTDFVPFPRSVLRDLHEHKLTPSEYDLYMRLRHRVDLYAKTIDSLDGITADFRKERGWSKSYVTKLLAHLKKNGYLYFERRAGCRGKFSILFPDIALRNGKLSKLPNAGIKKASTGNDGRGSETSEVSQSFSVSSQSFDEVKHSKKALADKLSVPAVRGSYNDTENEKKKKRSYPLKREILVRDYEPTGHAENRCKEIAIAIGERTMDFLLGTLHKHGILLVDQAWREYKRADESKMENRARYFNGIVKNLIAAKNDPP